MTPSLTPGVTPLVSSKLADYLSVEADESSDLQTDEFDRLIEAEDLRIGRFAFFRDMDIWLLILTNRSIIGRRLSDYAFLEKATDQQLEDYSLSATGIHWPSIDADLSLRGGVMEEAVKTFRTSGMLSATGKGQ